MDTFNSFLQPHLIWFIVGVILLMAEFFIPGIVTVFFGLGAWFVAIFCLFFDISLNVQLLLFIISSLILLIALRNWIKSRLNVSHSPSEFFDEELENFLGQKAVVVKKITADSKGKVEFHGSYWDAEAYETISKGAPVEIIDKRNITLIVNPL